MKKLAILTLSAVLLFGFVACGDDDDSLYVNSGGSKLRVKNEGTTDVLLYKGEPANTRPFAGVPAGQEYGIPNADDGLWVLTVVTQNAYNQSPSDPKIAMSILVYVDNVVATYVVSGAGVGNSEIMISNQSQYYVEVRENSFEGALFLTARPWEMASKFVAEKSYYLYPIVKVPQKLANGTIVGMFSKTLVEGRKMLQAYPDASPVPFINVTPANINSTSVEALIYIYNNWGRNAQVRAGSAPDAGLIRNTFGREIVNTGNIDPFIISRVSQLNDQGEATQPLFGVTLALQDFGVSTTQWEGNVEIGKVYSLTFTSTGVPQMSDNVGILE